jgi:hypothetical protein
MAEFMTPAVAVAKTARERPLGRPTIAAICRPITGGAVEPEFVADEIRCQGFSLIPISAESADFSAADVLIFLGNAAWRPQVIRQLRQTPKALRPFVAVWHWEPLPPSRASGLPRPKLGLRELGKIVLRDPRATDPYTNFSILKRLRQEGIVDFLAVSTRGRQEFLEEQGIASSFIPLGCGPQHGQDLGLDRDIDVLFLGDVRMARRRRALDFLNRNGIHVTVAGSWEDPQYWGEHRTKLLNRTKILLNVARTAGDYSGLRMLLGAANGAAILSEPLYRPEPFLPGQHYIEAELQQLPSAAACLLQNHARRTALTAAAREHATRVATRSRSVAALLEAIEDARTEGRQ